MSVNFNPVTAFNNAYDAAPGFLGYNNSPSNLQGTPQGNYLLGLARGQVAPYNAGAGAPYGSPQQTTPQATPTPQDNGTANIDPNAAANAAQAAYYANQNALLDQVSGRLDTQRGVANQNALSQYNQALSTLLGQKNLQHQQFDTTKQSDINNYQQGGQQIDQGVHNAYTGIQRLLGAHGAGNGSAASILAPYAAATQGNQQRVGLQQSYGQNQTNLKNAINAYDTNYDNSVGDLGVQKQGVLDKINSAYDTNKANILQQKATLSGNPGAYQDQINSLLNSVDQLGLLPTYTPKTPTYTAPTLQGYNPNPIAAPTVGGVAPSAVQNTGAYWNLLNGQDKKQQLAGASPLNAPVAAGVGA